MDFRFGTVFLHKYVCFHGEEPRRKSMSSSRALAIISKQLSRFAPMPYKTNVFIQQTNIIYLVGVW